MLYVAEGGAVCGEFLPEAGISGCEAGGGIFRDQGDGHGKIINVKGLGIRK